MGFVHFTLTAADDSNLGWAVFAVSLADGQLVAAKSLIPDKRGEEVIVSELLTV